MVTVTQDCLTVASIGPWIKICQHRPKAETYLEQNMTVITSIKVKRLIRLFVQFKSVAAQPVIWSLSGSILDIVITQMSWEGRQMPPGKAYVKLSSFSFLPQIKGRTSA